MSEITNTDVNTEMASPPVRVKELETEYAPYRHVVYKICKNCGKMFMMTESSVVYFVQKFGSVPTRCPDCREAKRARYAERNASTENS